MLRTKFKWEPQEIRETDSLIRTFAKHVEPKQTPNVIESDPDDNRIVECAVESASEAIVTHDKDLLRMKEYQGIKMLKVGEFLRRTP